NPLLYQGIRNANRRDMDDLVELLDDRLPGGDSGGSSPDSAEEYEQQAEEEAQEDTSSVSHNGDGASATDDSTAGDESGRTTPGWTGFAESMKDQNSSRDT
ncbi:MAG: hypothetical protein L0G70_06195, partial [Rubrobacter sp.]|nr:hypothetical protein [Rubrobacter sp.]